ncbi:hypothetical protein GCM10011352_39290 [Marinobacterium zhoushanense]|uniref:Methyltransferase FkbM domain-containing protein n=1 Tax=Marinobacterium zhoushanense TaxID=1679163 RepID=A0ABQ1KTS9_9GAMM|nr:FkbM family methyltransferase [Marinobacterium zhoushanense]GGC09053.1 hypothetical protein GCM10011352_39290 [Marinobacterium zhoushanense]
MLRTLEQLVKPYYRYRGYYPARIHGQDFRLDPYHTRFWRRAARGLWEPELFTLLRRHLQPDRVFCDIGAWIGPSTIYAARLCKRVICFEPDPVAYRYLSWNIELNRLTNVSPFCLALAPRMGIETLASFGGELGDSMSSLLKIDEATETATALTLEWTRFIELANPGRIDLIKLDIEGGEFDLLPTMADYLATELPVLYLSTHAPFLESSMRRSRLQALADLLAFYPHCYDQHFKPASMEDLASEDSAEHFRTFLLSP